MRERAVLPSVVVLPVPRAEVVARIVLDPRHPRWQSNLALLLTAPSRTATCSLRSMVASY